MGSAVRLKERVVGTIFQELIPRAGWPGLPPEWGIQKFSTSLSADNGIASTEFRT